MDTLWHDNRSTRPLLKHVIYYNSGSEVGSGHYRSLLCLIRPVSFFQFYVRRADGQEDHRQSETDVRQLWVQLLRDPAVQKEQWVLARLITWHHVSRVIAVAALTERYETSCPRVWIVVPPSRTITFIIRESVEYLICWSIKKKKRKMVMKGQFLTAWGRCVDPKI